MLSTLAATACAAVLAYGTDPYWAKFERGLGIILFAHRLQWILAAASLLLCVGVVFIILGGRFRAGWLIVLGPVLMLFIHRFVASPARAYAILEDPACVKPEAAGMIGGGDSIVGVQVDGAAYAYPLAALNAAPVVLQSSHEHRFILIWSPYANRAVAYRIDREIKLRELQIVSMPANALLLYNGRTGQFINGITGETTKHEKPTGFHQSLSTYKLTWRQWKVLHPATVVLQTNRAGPALAMSPTNPMPAPTMPKTAGARVIFAPTTRPVAVPCDLVGPDPANITDGITPLLMFRDRQTGVLRIYERQLKDGLFPVFRRKTDPKRPRVMMEDLDSGTEWAADGAALEGPLKGEQLKRLEVAVEDDLYWDVMKHWYPALAWVTPAAVDPGESVQNIPEPKRRGKPRKNP